MTKRTMRAAVRSGASVLLAGAILTAVAGVADAQTGFWSLFAPRAASPQIEQSHAAGPRAAGPHRAKSPGASSRAAKAHATKKHDDSAVWAANTAALAKSSGLLPAAAQGPVTIVVSTDRQRMTVYDGETPVAETVVSTGVKDHPTPYGVFSVIEKQVFHRSNIYSDAPMPFMQRLTWSGVAMHEGHVTGRPASHGCIRLPAAFARDLYRYTRRGARVIVAREDVKPTPIVDFAQALGAPPQRYVMGEAIEENRVPGEIAAPDAAVGRAAMATTRNIVASSPITAFVSRKTGKLYVRRNFKPIFEVPVTIDDPDERLGSHLYVAQPAAAGAQIEWSALSVTSRTREAMLNTSGARKTDRSDATPTSIEPSAEQAMARIHMAPGTAALVSSLLTPGAALIISDDELHSRENWDGTNFLALVR